MPLTLSDEQVAEVRRQLEEGQQAKQVKTFAESIWNDPELGDEVKAIVKRRHPQTPISDYDLKRQVFDRLDQEKKEREAAKQAEEEARETDRYRKQREDVQKQYNFTDDAMERMETEMKERKVYDYEAMAPYFASKQPKPAEETAPNHFWNHHKTDDFKKIVNDPEDYAFTEIVKAIRTDEQRNRER